MFKPTSKAAVAGAELGEEGDAVADEGGLEDAQPATRPRYSMSLPADAAGPAANPAAARGSWHRRVKPLQRPLWRRVKPLLATRTLEPRTMQHHDMPGEGGK